MKEINLNEISVREIEEYIDLKDIGLMLGLLDGMDMLEDSISENIDKFVRWYGGINHHKVNGEYRTTAGIIDDNGICHCYSYEDGYMSEKYGDIIEY